MTKRSQKQSEKENAVLIFDGLKKPFLKEKGVIEGKMFGSPMLKTKNKVFMFPWKGDLILKLPEERIEGLLKAKKGELFDPGTGRTSKTWIAVYPKAQKEWAGLSKESKLFVESSKK